MPFTSKLKNMFYQYIGKEYTYTRTKEGSPKIKVVPGEIVESELEEKYFTKNGFQIVEGKVEVKKTSKKKSKDIEIVAE